MINDKQYKGLQKGDKVTFHTEGDGKVRGLSRFEVLKVYPKAEENIGGPFVLDTEGEFHFLNEVTAIYVDSYAGGVPNASHVYWLEDAEIGEVKHDVIFQYAHRSGHPANDVWEHKGERIDTRELLDRVGPSRIFPLDERY